MLFFMVDLFATNQRGCMARILSLFAKILFALSMMFASFIFGLAAIIPYQIHGLVEHTLRVCFGVLAILAFCFIFMPLSVRLGSRATT